MRRLWRPIVVAAALGLFAPTLFAQPLAYVADPSANTVTAVNTGTNKITRTLKDIPGANAVVLNSGGTRVFVAESAASSGTVAVLDGTKVSDPNQNPLIKEIAVGDQAVALALSPDNLTLYVADGKKNQAEAVDLNNNQVAKAYAAGSGVCCVALAPAGHLLAIAASDKTVTLYALPWQDGSAVKTVVRLAATPKALAFDALGQTLWIATGSGFASYDRATGAVTSHDENGGTTSVSYDPRLGLAYFGAGSGNLVYTFAPATGKSGQIGTYGPVRGLALSADGTRLYAVENCSDCGLAVISTAQGQAVAQVHFGTAPATRGQFAGPGAIYAPNASTSGPVGEQLTGTVVATDGQGRSLSYSMLTAPALGQLNFNPDGSYAYTPPAGYSGLQAFVWQAAAASGEGSPIEPYSRPITQSFAIFPKVSAIADQSAKAGATIGPLMFTIAGTTPLTVTVTSNNKDIVNPAKAILSPGCGTSSLICNLTLVAGGTSGSARVTVQVGDPANLVTSGSFKVTVTGGSSSSGGDSALAPWPLAFLAALAGIVVIRRRRRNGRV